MMFIRSLLLGVLLLPVVGWAQKKEDKNAVPKPVVLNTPQRTAKNVILLVGSGLGLTQITGALYSNANKLQVERCPVAGLHKTSSANNLVSDAAASATALACGVKTYNGGLGVGADSLPVRSLCEDAEARGLATGVVVTGALTQPLPAAFVAHVKSATAENDIARAFLNLDIDFLAGGGKQFFEAPQADNRNLLVDLRQKGYLVADYRQGPLTSLTLDFKQNCAYFCAEGNPPTVKEGRTYLAPGSRLAVDLLKNHSQRGFFLVVGANQIDWAARANDSDYLVAEVLDFDRAVGLMLDFAKTDGETLVVVTATQEIGGYALNPGSEIGKMTPGFTSTTPTAQLVPVFAFGPGAELFSGVYENTDVHRRIRKALGWD